MPECYSDADLEPTYEPLAWWWLPLYVVGEIVIPLGLLAVLVGVAMAMTEIFS